MAEANAVTRAVVFDLQHAWAIRRARVKGKKEEEKEGSKVFSTWVELDSRDVGDPREIEVADKHWGFVYVISRCD